MSMERRPFSAKNQTL